MPRPVQRVMTVSPDSSIACTSQRASFDAAMIDADHVLHARRPLPGPGTAGIAIAVIGREQLIGDVEAARVAHLVEEAAHQLDISLVSLSRAIEPRPSA